MHKLVKNSYDWQMKKTMKNVRNYVDTLLQQNNFVCESVHWTSLHYHLLTSWKSSSCRFLTRIILSALLSTVFAQFKTDIVFYKYIKNLFTLFQSHLVIFAVIMIAHCIQKWKTEKFKLDKFEDFKVIDKFNVWILAENIWTDEVSLQVT